LDGLVEGKSALRIEDLTRVDFSGGYERGLVRMLEAR
jgi:hypothetical protein